MKALLILLSCVLTLFSTAKSFAHDGHSGFTHLTFNGGKIHAHATWEQGPQMQDESVLRIDWKSGIDHSPVEPNQFSVSLLMTDMGHGSAPPQIEPIKDASGNHIVGSYRVSQIYFVMGGKWDVQITLKNADGSQDMQAIHLDVGDHKHPGEHSMPGMPAMSSSASLAVSPAFAAICADGVTPHPTRPGYWHKDSPSFVLTSDTLFATLHPKPTADGEFALVKIDRAHSETYSEVTRFHEPIRALDYHNGKVWVLLRNQLVSVDPTTGTQLSRLTTASVDSVTGETDSQGMAWVGDQLFIAHGTLGARVFDERTNSIVGVYPLDLNQNGYVSKATAAAKIDDSHVVFAVEGVTLTKQAPWTFNGLIVLNTATGTTERFAYDHDLSGVLSNVSIQVAGDKVFVNNWGILQTLSLAAARQSHVLNVKWTPIHFDVNGRSESGELLGGILIEGQSAYACAETQYQDSSSGKVIHKGVVYTGAF